MLKRFFLLIVLILVFAKFGFSNSQSITKIEDGLEYLTFTKNEPQNKYKIFILRINPYRFSFKLLCANELKHKSMTCENWNKKYKLIACINASMYLPDGFKSTGFMKNRKYINNNRFNKRFGAFIAFNPKKNNYKKVTIIEKNSKSWKSTLTGYNTIVQNYLIISANQGIIWKRNKKKNSIAAFGIDKTGKVLFIISQNKITTRDFAKTLLKLPLKIHNLAYLEGGYEAVLNISHLKFKTKITGKIFNSQDFNINMKLPNIIGIRKK